MKAESKSCLKGYGKGDKSVHIIRFDVIFL